MRSTRAGSSIAPRSSDVLDAEAVERHAVGGGEDPRIDDAGAAQRERARDLHEQPRVIGREQHDLGARPEPVAAEIEGQRPALGLGLAHEAGMALVRREVEADPVARVVAAEEALDLAPAASWLSVSASACLAASMRSRRRPLASLPLIAASAS